MDNDVKPAAKLGAGLFLLWSVLHIWVGLEGLHQYFNAGASGLWPMLIGGTAMPRTSFVLSTDAATLYAQGQLLVNFVVDVGGYGVLGLVVAWLIWARGSWLGYGIGTVIIGICDLAFTFAMVTSGVIEANIPTVSGPIIWLLAVIITPFGLKRLNKAVLAV